ncbi:MAG: hypothetical protein PSV35_02020, partial [bacterium]|nr:hypothetical protein [bacterium]
EHAINQEYKHEHGNWLFDETKVTILYAQMHKIGVDHYDKPIVFDFYDDRRNNGSDAPDILEWLGAFYLSNSQLILQNIILRLNHYEWVGYNPSF